ncbi:MAG TPA: class I SAM-dependent methyltransferase [Cyclobacteriaceae bacterium]|jgi:SAM-dependent methyltransferase|nr:class I SAM-dependent methyltransferase [Cyclobacteriaceae bacterium]
MSKDLFSGHASQYAAFRPTYPKGLYDYLFAHVKEFGNAWDAGTGNGQVARDLCKRFKHVFGTDISDKQIENAVRTENISYSVAAETTSFPEKAFDLICVAQAIHWFDREKFYSEVKRVAKPQALLAIWGYGLLNINKDIDPIIGDFYKNIVGPYWDKERKLIDEEYRTIGFPFDEIKTPAFSFSFQWRLDELQGYLTTWSAVQKFRREKNINPVDELSENLNPLWHSTKLTVNFPLFARIGTV